MLKIVTKLYEVSQFMKLVIQRAGFKLNWLLQYQQIQIRCQFFRYSCAVYNVVMFQTIFNDPLTIIR